MVDAKEKGGALGLGEVFERVDRVFQAGLVVDLPVRVTPGGGYLLAEFDFPALLAQAVEIGVARNRQQIG